MKQAILLAAFVSAGVFSFARLRPINSNDHYFKETYNDTSLVQPWDIHEMLSEIMNVTGLQPNFELKEANVRNIEASISHHKRYILYNSSFIDQIHSLTKDKWAIMALLAHEVGHHLNGHTIRKTGSRPQLELEADEFAGFVLYKLGASLDQAQEVMQYIAEKEPSGTHPARNSRMLAVQRGWDKASEHNS